MGGGRDMISFITCFISNRGIAGSYDYSPKGERLSARSAFACALRLSISAKEHVTACAFMCVCG